MATGQGVGIAAPAFLALIGVVTTVAVLNRGQSGDIGARHMVVGQVAMTIMALRADQFLDDGVYVLGATILSAFAWESAEPPPKQPAWSEVNETMLIRAEGNYAHITTIHGARRLVRKSLSACAVAAPLMRVHRSYVVNLCHVRRLVARTGSRYELEMNDGNLIPVSRRAVAGIRERLKSNC